MVKRNISIKGARAGAKDVASRDASAAERKKPRPPPALNGNRSHTGKAENKRHPRIPAVKSHHFEYPNPFSVLDFQGFQGVKGYGFTTSLTGMDVVVCPSPQFMVADVGAEGRSATANVAADEWGLDGDDRIQCEGQEFSRFEPLRLKAGPHQGRTCRDRNDAEPETERRSLISLITSPLGIDAAPVDLATFQSKEEASAPLGFVGGRARAGESLRGKINAYRVTNRSRTRRF